MALRKRRCRSHHWQNQAGVIGLSAPAVRASRDRLIDATGLSANVGRLGDARSFDRALVNFCENALDGGINITAVHAQLLAMGAHSDAPYGGEVERKCEQSCGEVRPVWITR